MTYLAHELIPKAGDVASTSNRVFVGKVWSRGRDSAIRLIVTNPTEKQRKTV